MRVTNDTVLCNLCLQDVDTEEPFQATHYCNNCNKNLCDGHVQFHKSKKSTKDHNLNPLLTSNHQQSPTATTAAPTTSVTSTATAPPIVINQQHYCKHHSDQLLEIYCEECDDVFCFKCALFNHKLHKLCDVKEIAKEKLLKVNELLKDLNSKKEIILQRNDQLKLTITKVKEQIDLNKNEIKQHCNDLHKCIDKKMEQLLLEVDKIGNERLQSLQNENNLLNNCNNDINNLYQLKNDNAIDILQNKLKLEKEINNLNNLNVLNNLNEMNEFKLNINKDKNNLINLINTKLGNIENTEIKNDQLLFNDNNTLQKENTLQNNQQENTFQNNLQNNLQLANNVNFDLIKFELISKFGGPNYGNGNDKLNYPRDIIYKNNLIYIADYNNYRILILDNLLNYKNEIKLNSYPISLAINSNNYLFIGCNNDIIYKYNLNTLQLFNEIKSNENYKFNYISGMTFDKENNLYICNNNNNEIIILNENNEFIRKFKINLYPIRILINNKNQIVITCYGEIQVYDKLGNFISNVKFNNSNLWGIINDKNDNYIICDYEYNKLLLLDNEFKLKKEFNENLNSPKGITLNKKNNQIYIVEEYESHCCKLFK